MRPVPYTPITLFFGGAPSSLCARYSANTTCRGERLPANLLRGIAPGEHSGEGLAVTGRGFATPSLGRDCQNGQERTRRAVRLGGRGESPSRVAIVGPLGSDETPRYRAVPQASAAPRETMRAGSRWAFCHGHLAHELMLALEHRRGELLELVGASLEGGPVRSGRVGSGRVRSGPVLEALCRCRGHCSGLPVDSYPLLDGPLRANSEFPLSSEVGDALAIIRWARDRRMGRRPGGALR